MCSHNHFCAITRVDYDEYRHCRESAASALASSAGKPYGSIPISAHLALILAICIAFKRQQRQLLSSWLHYTWFTIATNMSEIRYMIKLLINFACKLYNFTWLNGYWTNLFGNGYAMTGWWMMMAATLKTTRTATITKMSAAITVAAVPAMSFTSLSSSPSSLLSLKYANDCLVNKSTIQKSNFFMCCSQFRSQFISIVMLMINQIFSWLPNWLRTTQNVINNGRAMNSSEQIANNLFLNKTQYGNNDDTHPSYTTTLCQSNIIQLLDSFKQIDSAKSGNLKTFECIIPASTLKQNIQQKGLINKH